MGEVEVPYGQYEKAYEAIHSALRNIMAAPPGKKVTKLGFWEDVNGNLKYIKVYDGESLLFILTFSNAGAASAESWSITRSEG